MKESRIILVWALAGVFLAIYQHNKMIALRQKFSRCQAEILRLKKEEELSLCALTRLTSYEAAASSASINGFIPMNFSDVVFMVTDEEAEVGDDVAV